MEQPAAPPGQSWWSNFKAAAAFWRAPVVAGVTTGTGAWLVWYFTKVPCLMENAAAGLCNPGVLANYINLPALASCLAIGGGFATFTGGYNIIMLNKERQRADDAESRLAAERLRVDQIIEELREERRDERRQVAAERQDLLNLLQEERRQSAEERRLSAATQQAMMTTLAEISATLTRLAEQQQNGHRNGG